MKQAKLVARLCADWEGLVTVLCGWGLVAMHPDGRCSSAPQPMTAMTVRSRAQCVSYIAGVADTAVRNIYSETKVEEVWNTR